MTLFRFVTFLLLVSNFDGAAAPPVVINARPYPEMNALFERKDRWIGGDGVYSVEMGSERVLWLFSDTWVGAVRDGRRTNATIVNNTLGLQEGQGPGAKVDFIIREDAHGKPVAFITPEDKKGWFWLQAGILLEKRLYLFLAQIEQTDDKSVFGFRQTGQWLGVVANPLDAPAAWRVGQIRLPGVVFAPERVVSFGAAALLDGDYVYIYGTDEDLKKRSRGRSLVVARAPAAKVADFSSWRYFAKGEWVADSREAGRIADGMATELSVSRLPGTGQYVLIYTDRGLSPKIQARTSPRPWGEWSGPATVYECPEMARDKRLFCYAAKAHPSQADGDELVISYVVNSFDFWQVVREAGLYWPRFIRVRLAPGR